MHRRVIDCCDEIDEIIRQCKKENMDPDWAFEAKKTLWNEYVRRYIGNPRLIYADVEEMKREWVA